MGIGTSDINPNKTVFIVIEIMLIDNQDPAINGNRQPSPMPLLAPFCLGPSPLLPKV
jgi:hypothetical protein